MDIFWAAFGGGLAGSIGTLVGVLAVEFIRWQLSQPKLKLEVYLGVIEGGYVRRLQSEEPKHIIFTISNTRDRPMTVNQIGFVLKENAGRDVITPAIPIFLPHEITAGKALTAWIDITSYLQDSREGAYSPKNIKFAYAKTSDAREFRSKFAKDLVETLTAAQRELSDN